MGKNNQSGRRRVFRGAPLAALLLCTAASQSIAQIPAEVDTASSLGHVGVKDARIAQVDTSHIRIAVDLTITSSRGATLENFRLAGLRLNGLPVFAETLTQPVTLVKGRENVLPPMYVTAEFRDLTTVAPLRTMIEKQNVHVQGQIVADIRMNFMEKLAMHTEHPRISLTLSEDVPVTTGASAFQRQAALGVLTVIEMGMQGSSAVRKSLPSLESPWLRELEKQADSGIVQIESSYTLKEHDANYPVVFDQLGFRLISGQIVTTAEVQTPWEYDPEFMSRIKGGDAKILKGSNEVQLRSIRNQTTPLFFTHKDFTLEERGTADKDSLIVQGDKAGFAKITVRRRAAPDALAVIVFPVAPAGGFPSAPAAIAQQDSWQKVAVYRLRSDASGKQSVEAIELAARRDGKSIHLDHPLDPSFYGSPIMVPEGVLGIVQDEQTGAYLPADLAAAAAVNGSASPAGSASNR